eukprot:Filipodium_phascolosomae@DN8572_c0_g1_i1.p1
MNMYLVVVAVAVVVGLLLQAEGKRGGSRRRRRREENTMQSHIYQSRGDSASSSRQGEESRQNYQRMYNIRYNSKRPSIYDKSSRRSSI